MKYLTSIAAVLSLLVVSTLLEIFLGSCAPKVHAEIRAEMATENIALLKGIVEADKTYVGG